MGDEEVTSTAEGQAYGAEFQARINSAKGFNLNLAYTLVRSEFEDGSGKLIPSSWDSKHLLTLTTTKELKRNWRIGARWRFVGGLPYTPWDLEKSSYVEAWDAQGGPYPDYAQLNSLRLDPFHQLDLRIDKAYYFNKLTAKFYIDIQNFYNFQAEEPSIVVRSRDGDGNYITVDNGTKYVLREIESTSGTVLPTIGIIIQF